jgi:hypothetical protein
MACQWMESHPEITPANRADHATLWFVDDIRWGVNLQKNEPDGSWETTDTRGNIQGSREADGFTPG